MQYFRRSWYHRGEKPPEFMAESYTLKLCLSRACRYNPDATAGIIIVTASGGSLCRSSCACSRCACPPAQGTCLHCLEVPEIVPEVVADRSDSKSTLTDLQLYFEETARFFRKGKASGNEMATLASRRSNCGVVDPCFGATEGCCWAVTHTMHISSWTCDSHRPLCPLLVHHQEKMVWPWLNHGPRAAHGPLHGCLPGALALLLQGD